MSARVGTHRAGTLELMPSAFRSIYCHRQHSLLLYWHSLPCSSRERINSKDTITLLFLVSLEYNCQFQTTTIK